MLMTKRSVVFLVVILLVSVGAAVMAQPVSLGALVQDPVRFDHRSVIVTGTVGAVEGPGGAPSQTFLLVDGGVAIRVTGPAQRAVKPGDRVEVEGIFRFAGNQIDAFRVTWR